MSRQIDRKHIVGVKFTGNRMAAWAPDAEHLLAILGGEEPEQGVLEYLLTEGVRRFGADAGMVLERSGGGRRLQVVAEQGLPGELSEPAEIPASHGALAEALGTLRPVYATGLHALVGNALKRMTARERETVRLFQEGFQSALVVPMVATGEALGLLLFCYRQAEPQQALQLPAARFGRVAGLAMANLGARSRFGEAAAGRERAALARDLHDTVAQRLFSASMIAGVLPELWETDPTEARERTAELFQVTREAQSELRTLLVALRPATLAEAGLGTMLHKLAAATAERAGIPVEVTAEERRTAPPEVQVALYRVAQEALNNMVRHAEATRAWVVLRCLDGQAHLSISDDGRGFETGDVPAGHLGVGIMEERAKAVGARLQVISRPGSGTTVTMVWKEKRGRWCHGPTGADSGRHRG